MTFVKPSGAHRNTQNPHIIDFRGVIATSSSPAPAPAVSALRDGFEEEIERLCSVLNRSAIADGAIAARRFDSLASFSQVMANEITDL